MGKSTEKNKTKRNLLSEFESSSDNNKIKTKRVRLDREPNVDHVEPLPRPSTSSGLSNSNTNNDFVVQLVAKNDKRKVTKKLTGKLKENLKIGKEKIEKGRSIRSTAGFEFQQPKIKSKVVVPDKTKNNQATKQTRSRIVKLPVRYLDLENDKIGKNKLDKQGHRGNKFSKVKSKIDFDHDIATIDLHTDSEITGGNEVAVEHDGVELSVNGSDLDEFSDEDSMEIEAPRSNQPHHLRQNRSQYTQNSEPGEIVSDTEDTLELEQVSQRRPAATVAATKTKVGHAGVFEKFKHLKHDPEFNDFIDSILDKKLSDKRVVQKTDPRQGNNTNKQIQESNTNANHTHKMLKSPSDTTLYSPGLMRAGCTDINNHTVIEKISNFVDNIRLDSGRDGSNSAKSRHQSAANSATRHTQQPQQRQPVLREDNPDTDGEGVTEQLLLQAEKFKARVEAPRGESRDEYCNMIMPYDYERVKSKFVTDQGLGPIDREIFISQKL